MGCGASQEGKYTPTTPPRILKSLNSGYFVENNLGAGDLLKFYEPDEALSEKHGDFGRFIVAQRCVTHQLAALQPHGKGSTTQADLENEVAILRSLGHPNIARLREVCEDEASYYLAFELCTGGGLMEALEDYCIQMQEKADVVLAATCAIFQVLKAVEYMHKRQICHRNLSTDAVLLHDKERDVRKWQLVVHDFTQAREFKPGKKMKEKVPAKEGFIAPEMIEGGYTEACDIFACGAIICALLFGDPNPEGRWRKSLSAQESLVLRMMAADSSRPTATECMADTFFESMEEINRGQELSGRDLENMQRFCRANKLKKLAIHMSASHLSGAEVLKMKEMFELVDKDHSGAVCLSELKNAMQELFTTGSYRARAAIPADLERLMDLLDVDGSTTISYHEFIAAMTDRKHYSMDATCLAVFRTFDVNGDGHINRKELKEALQSQECKGNVNLAFAIDEVMSSDKDGDGTLDFEEFKAMMRDASSSDVQKLGKTRDDGQKDLLKKSPQDSWAHTF